MVFGIDSLPGNPVNVSNYVTIRPDRLVFVEANYTTEATLTVNTDSAAFSPSCSENLIFQICFSDFTFQNSKFRFCHVLVLHARPEGCKC